MNVCLIRLLWELTATICVKNLALSLEHSRHSINLSFAQYQYSQTWLRMGGSGKNSLNNQMTYYINKELIKYLPHVWRRQWHSTPEGNGTPLQYSCLENPMDGGAWWTAVHGVTKSRTRLSDFTFHFHALEKEMATHSSVLSWRIPGTGKPGGLPSMGLHRVGHD